MKFRTLLFFICLVVFACKKDRQDIPSFTNKASGEDRLQLTEIKKWVSEMAEPGATSGKTTFDLSQLKIDWGAAESFAGPNSNYWLIPVPGRPLVHKVPQGFRKIAFFRDSLGGLQIRILEFVPDILYWQRQGRVATSDYTGRILIYDRFYNYIGGKIYSGGKQIGRSKPLPAASNGQGLTTNKVAVIENCQWYDSNYTNAEGEVVIHAEQICTYTIYDDGFYPSESGGNGAVPVGDPIGDPGNGNGIPAPVIKPPEPSNLPGEDLDKIDPKDYVRCFGNLSNNGAVMKVTLYVQQPYPGTVFNVGTNSVGHVALGLSKSNGGTTIRQTVGFYPDASGFKKFHAPSKVIDNGAGMDYQLSITYDVTASQFQAILDYVNTPPTVYDIVESNCTTFAINALANGGVMAPDAYSVVGMNGTGGTQSAMTPAGLGNSISQMQGKPGVNTTGGSVPGSKGPCK